MGKELDLAASRLKAELMAISVLREEVSMAVRRKKETPVSGGLWDYRRLSIVSTIAYVSRPRIFTVGLSCIGFFIAPSESGCFILRNNITTNTSIQRADAKYS